MNHQMDIRKVGDVSISFCSVCKIQQTDPKFAEPCAGPPVFAETVVGARADAVVTLPEVKSPTPQGAKTMAGMIDLARLLDDLDEEKIAAEIVTLRAEIAAREVLLEAARAKRKITNQG